MNKIKILKKILPALKNNLENCQLCPRNCQVNRQKEKGYCRMNNKIKIHSAFLHFGEEPPISGKSGSGTIFFSGCSLRCVYCQNYKFSQLSEGKTISEKKLAKIMLNLEKKGAENINLVTASHFLPQVLTALKIALENGLTLPLVYNSSGYEKKDIVELIEPIIDSWLLDFKYINPETGEKYSNCPKYPHYFNQVGLYLYKQKKGQNKLNSGQIPPIIIRHLILPGQIESSEKIIYWLKKNMPGVPLSIMSQYQPYHQAKNYPKINRHLSRKEYEKIKKIVEELELDGWLQEYNPQEDLAGVYFKKE